MGEYIEIQIHLSACRRCCSARRLERQGRGPERCRIGLFHGKRVPDREWRAVESGGNDRRPSFIPVRIQGSSHQSPQWTLGRGHGQRSRPVCSRPHYRCNAGGCSSARFFRACAGYGRAGIGEIPRRTTASSGGFCRQPIENRPTALVTAADRDHPCGLVGTTIGAQLRRPDRKQSCSFRFSRSLVLSQTPPAISIMVTASVRRFIVMRWR
jgi:hypothetical protein